jgi:hypothetical protein
MKRRADSTFVLFDVTYVDGSQTSNRKVLSAMLGDWTATNRLKR